MSHFCVTVVIEGKNSLYLESSLDQALEPYDENGEWFAEGSRWDWWVVGGRWTGELISLDGRDCDIARKHNIDWDAIGAKQVASLKREYGRVTALEANPWLEPALVGENEEAYVRRLLAPFYTYAFLDANGDWHEKSRMGWFGQAIPSEDGGEGKNDWPAEYQSLLRAVKDDDYLVIVDCHV
jgi:hypothetical protein